MTGPQVVALERYIEILLVWRRRVALVSQTKAADIVTKHVEDSLALVSMIQPGARVADLGTGAGFPGMVVALARDDVRVHLVESQRRKASFLLEAAREAGAANVTVVEDRAEALARRPDWRGSFDLVVSRAVWPANDFFALALPLVRPGGLAVAMKTLRDAITSAPGYSRIDVREYRLSGGETRALLLARTGGST